MLCIPQFFCRKDSDDDAYLACILSLGAEKLLDAKAKHKSPRYLTTVASIMLLILIALHPSFWKAAQNWLSSIIDRHHVDTAWICLVTDDHCLLTGYWIESNFEKYWVVSREHSKMFHVDTDTLIFLFLWNKLLVLLLLMNMLVILFIRKLWLDVLWFWQHPSVHPLFLSPW